MTENDLPGFLLWADVGFALITLILIVGFTRGLGTRYKFGHSRIEVDPVPVTPDREHRFRIGGFRGTDSGSSVTDVKMSWRIRFDLGSGNYRHSHGPYTAHGEIAWSPAGDGLKGTLRLDPASIKLNTIDSDDRPELLLTVHAGAMRKVVYAVPITSEPATSKPGC